MPLSGALMRHATYPRRIAWQSAIIGGAFFVLFTSILLDFTWHQRDRQHEQLLINSRNALQQTLSTLISDTLNPLLSFSHADCYAINHELTSRAAFTDNLRTILLVKNGYAFCSSATGSIYLPLSALSTHIDLTRDKDLKLLSDSTLQSPQPVLALWLGNPGSIQSGVFATLNLPLAPYQLLASSYPEISGIALVTDNGALTSWQSTVSDNSDLPPPLMTLTLSGYPLQFVLYGSTLSLNDYQTIILSGMLLSLLVGGLCWLVLSRYQRPGKEILQGIKRGEFHVEYQPLITSHDGQPYGVEALLRWTHPTYGAITPDVFITYAEAQNLIIPLTRHLFQLVARDAHQLCRHAPVGTIVGLNISPLHLAADSFRDDVTRWLDTMPGGHFNYVFEITERTMVREKNAADLFNWLHCHGIKIAIDDFGTGHSALIYLEKYAFDYLKIDRGFVQSIDTETLTSPVLDTVLQLAKKLKMSTVAEGVETGDQASWLISRGVTHLQGYMFSRPLRPEPLIDYFQLHNT